MRPLYKRKLKKNRQLKKINRQIVFGLTVIFVLLMILNHGLAANNLLVNPSFENDLSGWATEGEVVWADTGLTNSTVNQGITFDSFGGAVAFTNIHNPSQISQDFYIDSDVEKLTLSFAFKGTVEVLNSELKVKINDGSNEIAVLISNEQVSPKDNGWSAVEDLNLLQYLSQAGTYKLIIEYSLTDGTGNNQSGDSTSSGETEGSATLLVDEITLVQKIRDLIPPETPGEVYVEDTTRGGELKVIWKPSPSEDVSLYEVHRSTVIDSIYQEEWEQVAIVQSSEYIDRGLTDGTTYFYRVMAQDYSGNLSEPSQPGSATPSHDTVPPGSPERLIVIDRGEGGTLHLAWVTPEDNDVIGFNIYRSEESGSGFIKVNSSLITDTSYIDTLLENGITYYYHVTSVDKADNESTSSNSMDGMPTLDEIPPSAPENLQVLDPGTGRELNLNWSGSPEKDVKYYNIYRGLKENPEWSLLGTVGHSVYHFTDTSVKKDILYTYQITAVDWAGNESRPSEEAAGRAVDTTPPMAPTGLKIQDLGTGDSLVLSWQTNPEPDVVTYLVYGGKAGEKMIFLGEVGFLTNQFLQMGLITSQMYHYQVVAVDDSGNISAFSNLIKGMPRYIVSLMSTVAEGETPHRVKLELESPIIFQQLGNRELVLKVAGINELGEEVPVSGKWRFYSPQNNFVNVHQESDTMVSSVFTGNIPGSYPISVELVLPDGTSLWAEEAIDVVDWKFRLKLSENVAEVGSKDIVLLPKVTDHLDQYVDNPHIKVKYIIDSREKVNRTKKAQQTVGRYQIDGRVVYVDNEAKLGASTIPTKNKVKAVLYWEDRTRPWYKPVKVEETRWHEVKVVPGPPAFLGWDVPDNKVSLGQYTQVKLQAYDKFGNPVSAPEVKAAIVARPGFEFSMDQGSSWGKTTWTECELGSEVWVRPTAAGMAPGITAALDVYVMEGLSGDNLPSQMGQINQPLYLHLE